jgi:SPP1 gp7 family putative phage head morphogenesis protein
MPTENDLHRELAAFAPDILALLDSIDFFELEGPYDAQELISSIPARARREYQTESKSKNSRVWPIVGSIFVAAGLSSGISQIKAEYPRQVAASPKRLTAQDYQSKYLKEHGGEFITRMSHTDQKRLTNFLWQNAGKNERPLAKQILKQEPQLAYLVDNKEYRLKTIKRTEISRATNYGGYSFAKDNGFAKKTWHTAGDARVRPSHRSISGETVKIDAKFSNGYEYPQEINCRCHLSYS